MDSYFEKGIRLKGTLWVKGLVHFDGDFEGEIYSSDHFVVGKSGKILGNIKTYNVTNMGFIQGNLFAENKVALMNDSDFGLTASIWTQDEQMALDLAEQLETGTVFMSRCDYLDPALAWTGVKNSGRGCTLSSMGYEALTRPKSIHLRSKI